MHYPGQIPKWEGLRDERYVYATYFEQSPPFEFLHDLEADPMQLVNLAGDPRYRGALDRARRRTDTLRNSYGGPFAVHEEPEPRTPNVDGFMAHPVIETPPSTSSRGMERPLLAATYPRRCAALRATRLYPHQHGLTGNDPTIPLKPRTRVTSSLPEQCSAHHQCRRNPYRLADRGVSSSPARQLCSFTDGDPRHRRIVPDFRFSFFSWYATGAARPPQRRPYLLT